MDFLPKEIEAYAQKHTSQASELLNEVERDTHLEVLMPRMLSGSLQGAFLASMAAMLRAENLLEIGTYTGYSALWFMRLLGPEAHLDTIDINKSLQSRVQNYFEKAKLSHQITCHFEDAITLIPKLNRVYDLVFIDADKANYATYFDLVIDKVRKGGCILADNVLWSGKIIDPKANDKDTVALRAFNEKVQNDPRVFNILLPIRDGIMICIKL